MANGMYYICIALYSPFLSAFFSSRGMSAGQIGILAAVAPVASLLIQPIWARISDRSGKRRIVIQILCIGCAAALLLFTRSFTFATIFLSLVAYGFFFCAMLPLTDALVVHTAQEQGVRFSLIRLCGTLSYAAVVFPVGFLIKVNYNLLFYMNALCYLFTVYIYLHFKSMDHVPEKEPGTGEKIWRKHQKMTKAGPLFHSKEIVGVLILAFGMQLGLMFNGSFMGVYLLQKGHDASILGVLNCISALSEVPILLFSDKLMKKFSATQLLFLSVFASITRLLLTSSGLIPLIMIGQMLQGPSYMVCYMTCVLFISRNVDEDRISEGQGVLTFVQAGLGAITGNLLGGFLAEHFGIQMSYYCMAGFLTLLTVIVFVMNRMHARTAGKIDKSAV